jgi:hypothetical protein
MIFRKKDRVKHVKNLDKLVTGLIIGWAVASVIGLSRRKKSRVVVENIANEWKKIAQNGTQVAKKWYSIFGKILIFFLRIFTPKQK